MAHDVDSLTKVELSSTTTSSHAPVQANTTEHIQTPKEAMARKKAMGMSLIMAGVVVLAGIGSGYALYSFFPVSGNAGKGEATVPVTLAPDQIEVGKVYGAEDEADFPDIAEGVLVKGGLEGEGSHHLVRPGGTDQYVYLTSTVLDLDLFVSARVQVWGETFNAQRAGWLMDVGRVQVKELNAAEASDSAPPPDGAEAE
jgi:hypothetical protein